MDLSNPPINFLKESFHHKLYDNYILNITQAVTVTVTKCPDFCSGSKKLKANLTNFAGKPAKLAETKS